MLLDMAIPASIRTPINDMTLSVVPVATSVNNTPEMAGGRANKMINGSLNERNWATRIRYSNTTESVNPIAKLLNDAFIASTVPRTVASTFAGSLTVLTIESIFFESTPTSSPDGLT